MPSPHATRTSHGTRRDATSEDGGLESKGRPVPADPLATPARCTGAAPPPVWMRRERFIVSIDYDFGECTSIGHDAQALSCDPSNGEATNPRWSSGRSGALAQA